MTNPTTPDPLSDLQRLGQEFDADVVEAVAETLALHALPARYSWAGLHESARELWREDARAAIAAARPTIEAQAFEKAAKLIEADDFRIGDFGLDLRDFDGLGSWLKAVRAAAIRSLVEPRP